MELFDTHCHLNDPAFDEDRPEAVKRMLEAGVTRAVIVGDATNDGSDVTGLLKDHPFLYGAYGLHPHDAQKWQESFAVRIAEVLKKERFVALGEIGLDYHYDFSPREAQKQVFIRQLELAHELDIPAVFHIREAHGDAYDILTSCIRRGIRVQGVMHCFGGSLESALEYVRMGLYISFSGSLTFKNAPILTRCAVNLPRDRILIETDSPYMAPVPLRGRRNEPAFVAHVCEKLSSLLGLSMEETALTTYQNALNAFHIRSEEPSHV